MNKKAICTLLAALTLTACGADKDKDGSKPDSSSVKAIEAAASAENSDSSDNSSYSDTDTSTDDSSKKSDSSAANGSEAKADSSDSKSADRKALSKEITLEYNKKAEVYSRIKLSDLVTTNAELKYPDMLLDTSETGSHKQQIELIYKGETFTKNLSYKVVDTTAPVCLNPGYGSVISPGSYFDLNSLVGFADNYDRKPTLDYSGYVDTYTEGVYPITVTVTDDSGNSTSWDLDVTVAYQDGGSSYDPGDQIYFSDFMKLYAGDGVHFGIDVSKWQGSIDFTAVENAGCEFVIIRMGYSSEGYIYPDEYFEQNLKNARAAGLKVGVYFYSEDSRADIARGVARYVAETLGGSKLDFPVAFDWEDFYHFQNYGMSIHDLSEVFEAFADELDRSGYETMLYSSKNFLENFWENSGNHPVWVANYNSTDNYSGSHILWQRCGNGIIDGIDGAVDLDILYDR